MIAAAADRVQCGCLGSGDLAHGGGRWAEVGESRTDDRPRADHPRDVCRPFPFRFRRPAVAIRLPGYPHGPYRATGATATAASGETDPAVVTAQPGESEPARAVLRSALAVCRGVGAAYHMRGAVGRWEKSVGGRRVALRSTPLRSDTQGGRWGYP